MDNFIMDTVPTYLIEPFAGKESQTVACRSQ